MERILYHLILYIKYYTEYILHMKKFNLICNGPKTAVNV